jgi:hypothetical protein
MPLPTQQMMDVLHFSLDDLTSNRSGQLSSRQLWSLVGETTMATSFAVFAVGLFAYAALVMRSTSWERFAWYFGSIGCIAFGGWLAANQLADLVTRRVSVAEGTLGFTNVGRGAGIVVGGHSLPTPPCSNVLGGGGKYRVYYLAHSSTFLSIERLDDASTTETSVR